MSCSSLVELKSSDRCFKLTWACRFGTMEELMEMVTWQQLGYHKKPVGLLNICGFYDALLQFFDRFLL